MAITIRDVARQAGVSPSTVSRVLNNKGVISDETTKRIQQAMHDLNYVPNDFARGFATGSPRAIALVVDTVNSDAYSNYFFNNTVFGIEATAHKNDYSLIITNGSKAFGGMSSIERYILGGKLDGIIVPASMADADLVNLLLDQQFPCVILGRQENSTYEISWVDINNIQAGSLAVRHLQQMGYHRIAFLAEDDAEQFTRDRIIGFNRENNILGLSTDSSMIVYGLHSMESSKQATIEMLEKEDRPDAIICNNDKLALGALRAARKVGIDCPSEFGILSFDNTDITELTEPAITSIDVDTYELGVQSAEILINKIENPEANIRQTLLSTKIIERPSTIKS